MLTGQLDLISRHKITGWAFDERNPSRPVRLVITRNGVVVGRLLADRYRRDLQEAGIGDGKHSFEFSLSPDVATLGPQDIGVLHEHDGTHLQGSPATLSILLTFAPEDRNLLAGYLTAESTAEVILSKIEFLVEQLNVLLARHADQTAGRHLRERHQQLRQRWGKHDAVSEEPRGSAPKLPPRALIIDDRVPRLDRDAGSNAIVSHIQSLQRLGFDATFVASQEFGAPHTSSADLDALDVATCTAPYYGSIEEVLLRQAGQFDLIYLHRVTNAAKYGALAREYNPRAAIIFSVADLHHLRIARQAQAEQRPELEPLARRLRLSELTAAALSDAVITHSTRETEILQAAVPHARVVTVPWAVAARPVQRLFEERHGVAFIGGFGHDPNRDAARWLINDILPLIRKEAAIECLLVGSDLPEEIRQLCGAGVVPTGQVANLHDIFERVRLTIAPLAFGAGVKGKVLESFAAGVPCVCTPIAAEGIPLSRELNDCVVDGAEGLAALALKLHADAGLNQAMARAGLALVRTFWSDERMDAAMRLALGRLLPAP